MPKHEAHLKPVQVAGVDGVPLGPDVGVLPHRAIAGAGNVAQDAVELQLARAAVWINQ